MAQDKPSAARAQDLIQQGNELFTKKQEVDYLWQEIADQFYPERADFTVKRNMGQDFADHLSTSYPILARRDLGNQMSSMLRPKGQHWFHLGIKGAENLSNMDRRWLEMARSRMRGAMYDPKSQFVRSAREADHDFITFGNCVISHELSPSADGMLYKTWHLRDCAWCENIYGEADTVHRKWDTSVRHLKQLFGEDKLSERLLNNTKDKPNTKVNCRHIQMPREDYNNMYGDQNEIPERFPYVSIYIDMDNQHIIEETPLPHKYYTVARWQTVSGSQYAYSPATVAALPDARLIQSMTLTLLEAGEKATNPPLIGQDGVVRSDVGLYAGGVTWVDQSYDERLGESLRPIPQDYRNIPTGMEMQQDVRSMIHSALYLDRLSLPPAGDSPDMTAYEVGQRVQEYVRNAMPLFEPLETEYSASVCDNTFDIMMRAGAFGSPLDIPEEIQGEDVEFTFESPLHDALEKQKQQIFMQSKAMLAEAVALDQTAAYTVDVRGALRDALQGSGMPAEWLNSEDKVKRLDQKAQQQQQQQQVLEQMQQGSEVAKTSSEATRELSEVSQRGLGGGLFGQ